MTPRDQVPASRGRLLLSIYLDFVVFSVPWALIHYFFLQPSPEFQRLSTPAKFVTFAILEILVHRVVRWSPGQWLLSIRHQESDAFVDAGIKAREHWFTLLVGVLVLLEGSKGLVRWTMWTPPTPMFGQLVTNEAWPYVAMTGGAIECFIACLIFRTRLRALAVAVPYFLLMIVSVVMSWRYWDSWVAESVRRRRGYQGIPIREGEIEMAQSITPEIVVAGIAFYLVIIVIAGVILRRRDRAWRSARESASRLPGDAGTLDRRGAVRGSARSPGVPARD